MLSMNTVLGCAACCFGSVLLVAGILLFALLLDGAAKMFTAVRFALVERESDAHDALVWLRARGCRWSALSQLRLAETIAHPDNRRGRARCAWAAIVSAKRAAAHSRLVGPGRAWAPPGAQGTLVRIRPLARARGFAACLQERGSGWPD